MKAELALAQRREDERWTRLQLELRVREGLSAWRTAMAEVEATTMRVETNRESVQAAEGLYRAGKATALDALTAQADLTRAAAELAQARAAYAAARAQVERLLGAAANNTTEGPR